MAVKDTWRRALEYFGLVDGGYLDDEYTDEHDAAMTQDYDEAPARARSREREGGRSRDREPEPEPEPELERSSRGSRRPRRALAEVDDFFAEDEAPRRSREAAPAGNGGHGDLSMHLVTPRSFNDAQQVADEYKRRKPVILNLQTSDRELSKRLIDFCSGLTYALGGGMQRIADRVFLLTPENVDVSAEEKARLLERGFFNQS